MDREKDVMVKIAYFSIFILLISASAKYIIHNTYNKSQNSEYNAPENSTESLEDMLVARVRYERMPHGLDRLDRELSRDRNEKISFKIEGLTEYEKYSLARRLSRKLGVPAYLIDDELAKYSEPYAMRAVSVDISNYQELYIHKK